MSKGDAWEMNKKNKWEMAPKSRLWLDQGAKRAMVGMGVEKTSSRNSGGPWLLVGRWS